MCAKPDVDIVDKQLHQTQILNICMPNWQRRSRAEDLRRKESRSSVYMKKWNMGDMDGLEPTKRKSKRMRYEVLENWGMGEEEGEHKPERAKTTGSERKTTPGGEYVDDEVRNHQELLGGDTGIRKMSP